jgi:initiation factor 1A
MPKNKIKGGKNENETEKRELVFKEDGQEYAQVTNMLGNGGLEAICFDGKSSFETNVTFRLWTLIQRSWESVSVCNQIK